MRRLAFRCLLPAAALLLTSCSHTEEEVVNLRDAAASGPKAPVPTNPLSPHGHDLQAVNYNVSSSEELAKIDNGAEGEVYFTDPTNPDKEIEGITAAFESRRRGNGWLADYGMATRLCRREQLPLVIWFHNSVTSPKSKTLGTEYLNTKKFDEWCNGRVIRLRLDAGASIDDTAKTKAKYSMGSIDALALRYGLRRKPALAVLSCTGKLMDSMDGFNGFVEEASQTIEKGVEAAEKENAAYRKKLEGRGYRMWSSSRDGRKLFAKLHRFDETAGLVYFKAPGGKILRCPLQRLCEEDIDYLDEEARAGRTGKKTTTTE